MKELKDFTTEEILEELLRREKSDNLFDLKLETSSSYTFKFYKI